MADYLYDHSKKPIRILGIATAKRRKYECAAEDPISTELLKITLKEAEKSGAETQLIDLHDLKIGACKECYSSCPAQCRFSEKIFRCDCYVRTHDHLYAKKGGAMKIEDAYDKLSKKEFFEAYNDEGMFSPRDDMHLVYKAMMNADAIIFSSFTSFYSRPALMQVMLSRLCALDGGVEELWGDGKNLKASYAYVKKNGKYKQRLYGRHVGFINSSKEGDMVTPDLLKACTMMGMKNIPLGVSYHVSWYNDASHKTDKKSALNDKYTLRLAKEMAKKMVEEIKQSTRKYGKIVDLV